MKGSTKRGFLAAEDLQANETERCRREALKSGALIDLTDANPTRHGLLFPAEVLEAAARKYLNSRAYEPQPKGLLPAREAIAAYYARRSPSFEISPEQIFITASTSESYSLLFSLLAEPGDVFLSPALSYPLFDLLALHHRVELQTYEFSDSPAVVEADGLELEDAAGIILISPHNPTGRTVTQALPRLAASGLPVIADEVFSEFPYSLSSIPPAACLYDENPVFLLNGLSKMFALPDLKLGWIALNKQAYALFGERLEFLNDTFLSASTLVQSMLPVIFAQGAVFQQALRKHIRNNIEYCVQALGNCKNVRCPAPEGGAFVFPEISAGYDEEALVIQLIKRGVYTHPGYFYGSSGVPRLLFSCIPARPLLERGICALKEIIG